MVSTACCRRRERQKKSVCLTGDYYIGSSLVNRGAKKFAWARGAILSQIVLTSICGPTRKAVPTNGRCNPGGRLTRNEGRKN
jgi:hypothetical protein